MNDYHELMAQRVVEQAEKLGRLIDYIEVGTFVGHSAEAVLSTCKVRQAILIDNFSLQLNGEKQSKQKVEQRLSPYDGLFEVVEGDSRVLLPRFSRRYDIGFVDGDHTDEGCRIDMDNMLPLLRDDGVMFVHDMLNPDFENLRIVAETFAREKGLRIEIHEVMNGLAELRR